MDMLVEMTMHRAFVPQEILKEASVGETIELPIDVAHRLTRVVRVKADEIVELFDGQGLLVRGALESKSQLFRVESVKQELKSKTNLLLAQALVSQSKLENIIQDATEVGVDRVILFVATHCVAKLTNRTKDQVERLRRIATDAARQSERPDVPTVLDPVSFSLLLSRLNDAKTQVFVGDPREGSQLVDALTDLDEKRDIVLIIGPEGGFTATEIEQLKGIGAKLVRYAPHVLRTETAGLVGLSIIQSRVR